MTPFLSDEIIANILSFLDYPDYHNPYGDDKLDVPASIPTAIDDPIFSADRRDAFNDLLNILHCCKRFKRIGLSDLYAEFAVKEGAVPDQWLTLSPERLQYLLPTCGHFIKRLDLRDIRDTNAFDRLFSHCPNLRHLAVCLGPKALVH